jgi:phosphate transport system substrate-binding protein
MKNFKKLSFMAVMVMVVLVIAACGGNDAAPNNNENGSAGLSGSVEIDGSSTVFPIMEAVTEEYRSVQPEVNASVGLSGTGGGFKKWVRGDIDINNASRPIKEEEAAIAKENGIDYIEIEVAYDGLTVVVNPENDFVESLTVDQLKQIFSAESGVTKWSQINPDWPNETITIYSPGHDSGTFDYFNEVILEDAPMREDENVMLSEDDNTLVTGVSGDENGIAYFGYAYYIENENKLKAVAIDGGNGPVLPDIDTIQSKEYSPLSRPMFIYVNKQALLDKPQVYDFVKFTIENAGFLAEEVGYVASPDEVYEKAMTDLEALK